MPWGEQRQCCIGPPPPPGPHLLRIKVYTEVNRAMPSPPPSEQICPHCIIIVKGQQKRKMAVRGHQRTRFTQCIIACQLHNQSRYGQQGILKSMAQPLELKVRQIHSTCLNIPYHQPIHHLKKMLYFPLIVAIKLLYCAPCTKESSNTMHVLDVFIIHCLQNPNVRANYTPNPA